MISISRQRWRAIARSGRRIGLLALMGTLGLAACQRQFTFLPTPMIYTATSLSASATPLPSARPDVSATPVPTALPTTALVSLGTPYGVAQVRVINASLDLRATNVQLGDQLITTALASGQATDWQTVAAGSFNFSVSGQTTILDLTPDARLDVIVYGPASALQIQPLAEDFSPLGSGQARLEVFNAAPGTSGVQPYSEGTLLSGFPGADYGQTSGPSLLGAQSFALQFRAADASGVVQSVEFKSAIPFKAGTVYLYVVTGSPPNIPAIVLNTPVGIGSAPVAGAILTPSGVLQFRLLNAMSDSTAVSLTLNGQRIFNNVAPGQTTDYQAIGPQFATWMLTNTEPAPTTLATADLLQIGQGTVTLIAIGTARAARFYQAVDVIPADVTNALLDVIHAAPNAQALRIEAQSTTPTSQPEAIPTRSLIEPTETVATQAATPRTTVDITPSPVGPVTATPLNRTGPTVLPSPTPGLLPTQTPFQRGLLVADRLHYGSLSPLRTMLSGSYTLTVRDNATGETLGQLNAVPILPGKRYDVLVLPGDTSGTLKLVVVASALPMSVASPTPQR